MNIEKELNGNFCKLTPEGWLDTQTAPELGEAAQSLPAEVNSLELDCSKLEYISSAGMRQLVSLYKKYEKLVLTNVSAGIMDVFRMTGFDKRLNIQQ